MNDFKGFLFLLSASCACVFVSPEPAVALDDTAKIIIERVDDSFPEHIENKDIFSLVQDPSLNLKYRDEIYAFYTQRNFKPYWDSSFWDGGDQQEFIEALELAWTHGLNPETYRTYEIGALSGQKGAAEARLDVLLTEAFIRYGRDLSGIRVNPGALKSHSRYWKQPMSAESLLALLDGRDVVDSLAVFTPRGTTYNRLREELVALAGRQPASYEADLPIRINGLLRPYEEHQAVPALRRRLGVMGDPQSVVYDDHLAAAIIAFQKAHNLEPDGLIGPSTLRRLNLSRESRIEQIVANLERLRWVPEEKPNKFVVVNVPSAMLWAVEDGAVRFEMPVIVGREKRATNIFITEITGVRLNPTWTVPPTIKREDIVPKLIEDPYYLVSKGMELTTGRGDGAMSLDPASIDWASVSAEELKSMHMVQVPGAHNPLGRVRVLMPNGYNIYLHDTNEKNLFEKDGRAVSSGCIRMKYPEQMAQFILENKNGWGDERMNAVLAGGEMKDIFLPKEALIPVYLVYYTVWIDGDNQVVYGNDLYDYDAEVIKMLSNIDGFFIPVDNNEDKGVN